MIPLGAACASLRERPTRAASSGVASADAPTNANLAPPTLARPARPWSAADKLRNNLDASEYKHVLLGLIFLKYISDAFEEKHAALEAEKGSGADPEDPDEYRAENVFWVPEEARWQFLLDHAKQPKIGQLVDDAMRAIEHDNPSLNVAFGDKASRSRDVLGDVYQCFLDKFASAEGKKSGQFYTPEWVVELLVEMLAPYPSRGSAALSVSPSRELGQLQAV